MKLSFKDRAGFLVKSLFLQGSWSFRHLQGLGFFYSISGWLERNVEDSTRSALRRHLGFFNTHPFMAPYLIGVVARLEKEGDPLGSISAKDILMSPLAALGDSLFWGTLRPLFIIIGLGISLYTPWLGIAYILISFNLFNIWTRWALLGKGFDNAKSPLDFISDRNYRGAVQGAQLIIIPALGFLFGLAAFRFASPAFSFIIFGLSLLLFSRGWGTFRTFLVVFVVALIIGWMGFGSELTWLPWK